MSGAIYALIGTLLGSASGFLVTWLNIKAQDRRTEDEALIETVLNFVSRIMRVRQLSQRIEQERAGHEAWDEGRRLKWEQDQRLYWDEAQRLIGEAEGDVEHLKVVADFEATQQAARLAVHHVYWLTRAARGYEYDGKPVDWQEHHDELRIWLTRFQVSGRREIGKRRPEAVNVERLGRGPTPTQVVKPL